MTAKVIRKLEQELQELIKAAEREHPGYKLDKTPKVSSKTHLRALEAVEDKKRQIEAVKSYNRTLPLLRQFAQENYYTLNELMGYQWWDKKTKKYISPMLYVLLGGWETGKSYAVMEYFVKRWKEDGIQFDWLRLSDEAVSSMLDDETKVIDADIVRKYGLSLSIRGSQVFDGGKLMMEIQSLSTFYNKKGAALFDNEYEGYIHVCLDEMNKELGEARRFDIAYAFTRAVENLIRSRQDNKVKVFMIGNLPEEVSDLLAEIGYIPTDFGIYKMRFKRCVIDYIEPSAAYKARRAGSLANLLQGRKAGLTNKYDINYANITKRRVHKPYYVIAFTGSKESWFTVWDRNVIKPYNGEKSPVIIMSAHQNYLYDKKTVEELIDAYNKMGFMYDHFKTRALFTKYMAINKPKG